jgi:hypothetical protein
MNMEYNFFGIKLNVYINIVHLINVVILNFFKKISFSVKYRKSIVHHIIAAYR